MHQVQCDKMLAFALIASTLIFRKVVATSISEPNYDTVFLIDASTYGGNSSTYDAINKFVSNVTVELVNEHHRVGMVTFNGEVYRVDLPLTDDVIKLAKGARKMSSTGGFKYISEALNITFATMFNDSVRIGNGKQVVVILGRRPNPLDAIYKTSAALKAKGLEIFCVGIGPEFFQNTTELQVMASLPIHDHTLRTTYKSLKTATSKMLQKLRKGSYGGIAKIMNRHQNVDLGEESETLHIKSSKGSIPEKDIMQSNTAKKPWTKKMKTGFSGVSNTWDYGK